MKVWTPEQRQWLRSRFFRRKKLRIGYRGQMQAAKVVDSSDHGLGVEMSAPLESDSVVSFVGIGLQGRARVVHCRPSDDGAFRAGLELEAVSFRKLGVSSRALPSETVKVHDSRDRSLNAGAIGEPKGQTRVPPAAKALGAAMAALLLLAAGIWSGVFRSGQPGTPSGVAESPNEVVPDALSTMITGIVQDSATQLPIADAEVHYAGEQGRTAASGHFQFPRQAGQNVVLAKAVGYRQSRFSFIDSEGPLRLQPLEVRAIYLSHKNLGNPERRKQLLNLIRDTSSNAIVVDVKDARGQLALPVNHALAREIGALDWLPAFDLTEAVEIWKAEGIYTIARIALFPDNRLGTARPELALRSLRTKQVIRDISGIVWTNPSASLVQGYNMEVAKAAARFDEIQFDFVRYPAGKFSLEGARLSERWRRVATISGFLRQVKSALAPYNVYVGATVLGSVCSTRQVGTLGQHLEEFAAAVDYISPILFPSDFGPSKGYPVPTKYPYEVVHQNLQQAIARLDGNSKKLRPWLQNFPDRASVQTPPSVENIRAQVRGARNAQTSGWMLRDLRNRYPNTLEAIQGLSQE